MVTPLSGMTVRAFLRSMVREQLRTRLMAWWLGKLDQDNRPTTYAQAEVTLLKSAAEGMTDLDDTAKYHALTELANTDQFRQQASDMLDAVAYHAVDHVNTMVKARTNDLIAEWAAKWPQLRTKLFKYTRCTDDWSKSVQCFRAVNALRREGVASGCPPLELDAVCYGYGRMLLAELYGDEGTDDGANTDLAPRGLDGAHDAGADDGRWMGTDYTKSHSESRFTEGNYDGGFTPGCGIMTAEELYDEATDQAAEVKAHRDLAFDAGQRGDWEDARHHKQTAWLVQTAGIVGRHK